MAKTVAEKRTESKLVIAVNETEVKAQLGQLVRQSSSLSDLGRINFTQP